MSTKTTLAEQTAEVAREIDLRKKSYPKLIADGKLSHALAERYLACMDGALKTLLWMQEREDWIKEEARKRK